MTKKQWLMLLMLFVTYLLLGAGIFLYIEEPLEQKALEEASEYRIRITDLLNKHYRTNSSEGEEEILDELAKYCGKSFSNSTTSDAESAQWNFYSSFYFVVTVVSTIGYGNLHPTTMVSRILMIFYALIGIPMNGILLSQLGDFFGGVFVKAHKKYKSYKDAQGDSPKKLKPLETGKVGLAAQIFMYLTPGFLIFIFFPAFIFKYVEEWSYDEAVYYAFVTLATIGFGDMVAGADRTKGSGFFFGLYKAFLICWICFGLGYLVMIMSFIARGMRSKKITRIEHKLATNLKLTQNKILNEFNKELNLLRSVFNELQLSKVKRIYVDDYESDTPPPQFPRSNSFPDMRDLIIGGFETHVPAHPRRRANSEVVPMQETITRVVSDTDLQRIDKNATFASSQAMAQPVDFLARLVQVLGHMPEEPGAQEEIPERNGVQGFSDKDILAGERSWNGSVWKMGSDKLSRPATRSRAISETKLEKDEDKVLQQNGEWTWSGPGASRNIQELMRARNRQVSSGSKGSRSKFPSFSLPAVSSTILPRWINPFSSKKNPAPEENAPPNRDLRTMLNDHYLSLNANSPLRKPMIPGRRRSMDLHTGEDSSGSKLLEETTLADFLRALTVLHTQVGAVPDEYTSRPKRKMGTASLNPPKLPSLLTLFSPPSGTTSPNQSNQNTFTSGQSPAMRFSRRPSENPTVSVPRRSSLISVMEPRRFSLRSTSGQGGPTMQSSPPYTAMNALNHHLIGSQYPPPYTASAFAFDGSRDPLVPLERAPGVSSPMVHKSSPTPRRFSLRPAQIGVPPAPASQVITKPAVPRWKAGMLQRQIGEMSLQRRARASSLGDMSHDRPERPLGLSPLAMTEITGAKKSLVSGQDMIVKDSTEKSVAPMTTKSVEIVPPPLLSSTRETDAKQSKIETAPKPPSEPFTQTKSIDSIYPLLERRTAEPCQDNILRAQTDPLRSVARDPLRGYETGINPFVPGQSTGERKNVLSSELNTDSYHNNETGNRDSGKTNIGHQPPISELVSVIVNEASKKADMNKGRTTPLMSELSLTEIRVEKPSLPLHKDGTRSPPSSSQDGNTSVKLSPENIDEQRIQKFSRISQDAISIAHHPRESEGQTSKTASGTDVSVDRKSSATSQQSNIIESTSSRGTSSTFHQRGEKPRVPIDSYKPLMETRIKKPSMDPFEQYRATLESRMEKPKD